MKFLKSPLVGFLSLGAGLYLLRESSSLPSIALMVALVIYFWWSNGLNLGNFNLRRLALISLFGLLIAFGVAIGIPGLSSTGQMGLDLQHDLHPGQIAQLAKSDKIALSVDYDERPTGDERYFKLKTYEATRDGLNYATTSETLDPSLFPKTKQWVDEQADSDFLNQVKVWWTNKMIYSLTPGELQSAQPLDQLLFENQRGYCEHFAAALTTLLTLKGQRARVAVGFFDGEWSRLFHHVTFRDSDAHAWVEVYQPETRHWQIVDPAEWLQVAPTSQDNFSYFWILAGFAIVAVLAVTLMRPKAKGFAAQLITRVDRVEKSLKLDGTGLTLSERLRRLSTLRPDLKDSVERLILVYNESEFSDRPVAPDRYELLREI